jgi:antitoxin component YwqK of YwqJK toxin-antitoxin module
MKKILLFILLAGLTRAYGQKMNDYEYEKVRIVDTAQEIEASIQSYSSAPRPKPDRFYYWYKANAIHATQGGFGGQLLNGSYFAYYPDKSLKEEGAFKKGLKAGPWKTWNRKGELISTVVWDDGIIATPKLPIWKRLPFISKKPAQPQTTPPVPTQ